MFDTPARIAAQAALIYQQAAVTRIMPLNNATEITEEERQTISQWYQSGAKSQ